MEIAHDGCEATRDEKAAYITWCDAAMKWLRVCWENRDGAYNCGRCTKCLGTMVNLRIAGALERCRTFDRPLDLGELSRMERDNIHFHTRIEDSLRAVERVGNDPALAEALRDCLRRATTGSDQEGVPLVDQLKEREAETAALRALVAGYERGRVMRLLNAIGRLQQRLARLPQGA